MAGTWLLCQRDMFGARLVGRRQIPPGERAFLTIGLPERHRQMRSSELLADVERMRRLVHSELREDLLNVRAAHEPIVVEDGDGLGIRKNPEVRIRDAR